MKRYKIMLLLFLVYNSFSSSAQNFEDYYQEAADNHPALKAVFNEYYAILEQKAQVNKLPPPEIAFGAFILPVETRLGAQRAKLGLSQMFPPIGQLRAKEKMVVTQASVKLQEAEIKRNQLYFELQNNWYELLKIEAITSVIQKQKSRLDVFEELALQKIEIAKGSTANVYRISLKRNELENEIALLKNQQPALISAFKSILNNKDSISIILPDTISLRTVLYPKDSLLQWIKQQNPELQLFELKKEVLDQKTVLRKTQNKASFGVGVDYTWLSKRTDMDPAFNGQGILMARAVVKVPIYKTQNKARLKEVDFERLALDYKKEAFENILAVSLEQALTQYRAAQLEAQFYLKQVDFTKKTLDVLIANYSVDASDFEEILRIENQLFQFERMLVMSKIKQNRAVVNIEKLFAQPLN